MALNTLIVVSQDDEHELLKPHCFVRNQTMRYQNCLQRLNVCSLSIAPFVQNIFFRAFRTVYAILSPGILSYYLQPMSAIITKVAIHYFELRQ